MHAKISDFGCAKQLTDSKARSNSFCGTAEYVCPELLVEKSAGIQADMWSFGCLLYQLCTGRMPFRGFNDYTTFQAVIKNDYVLPEWLPLDTRDLIKRLLVSHPLERLTAEEAKKHPFFADVPWDTIHLLAPPQMMGSPYFIPLSPSLGHLSPPLDTPPQENLSPSSSPTDSPLSPSPELPPSLSASNSSVRETSTSISSNVSSSPPSTPPSSPPASNFVHRSSPSSSGHKRSESAHTNKWPFLNANEEILKTGWMHKRTSALIPTRKRMLVLTTQRMVLVNPKGVVKCSVCWGVDSLTVGSKNEKVLILTTAAQVFKLIVPQEELGVWVDDINAHHTRKVYTKEGSVSHVHAPAHTQVNTMSVAVAATKRSNSIL